MKHLVVSLDSPTPDTANAITEFLRDSFDVRFSHYLQSTWLVRDPADRPSTWWRDRIMELAPDSACLVLDVTPRSWASRGLPEMTPWMQKAWRRQ